MQFRNNILKSLNPVQWCIPCLKAMDVGAEPTLTKLKNRIGCYDHQRNVCVECGEDNCLTRYHVIKTLKICMYCVIEGQCLCRMCQMSPVDIFVLNQLRVIWKNVITVFNQKKEIYPMARPRMEHFLHRENFQVEDSTIFQYTSVDANSVSSQAFNVYNVVCTYADVQELLDGTGIKLPYLKATVVRIFFLLLLDKLNSDKMTFYLQNTMTIDATLSTLFCNSEDGIFLYDYFIYTGVHDNIWCSVVVEKTEKFVYDVITFLPGNECSDANAVVSSLVEQAMKQQYEELKKRNSAESPWQWEKLILRKKEIKDETPLPKFRTVDAGIYTIFKTYLYLCYREEMEVKADDLHKFRRLVLYMMITMDINYGQMKIGNDAPPEKSFLRF